MRRTIAAVLRAAAARIHVDPKPDWTGVAPISEIRQYVNTGPVDPEHLARMMGRRLYGRGVA